MGSVLNISIELIFVELETPYTIRSSHTQRRAHFPALRLHDLRSAWTSRMLSSAHRVGDVT